LFALEVVFHEPKKVQNSSTLNGLIREILNCSIRENRSAFISAIVQN
jgi:hypothetical protein